MEDSRQCISLHKTKVENLVSVQIILYACLSYTWWLWNKQTNDRKSLTEITRTITVTSHCVNAPATRVLFNRLKTNKPPKLRVDSPHKGPVMQKAFLCHDVTVLWSNVGWTNMVSMPVIYDRQRRRAVSFQQIRNPLRVKIVQRLNCSCFLLGDMGFALLWQIT